MFNPKFNYTSKLVANLGLIRELVVTLNLRRFPNTVLVRLEKDARALSSFSSTSIEGNTLPLTDVKRILKSKPQNIRDTEREVLNYNNALILLDERIKAGDDLELTNGLICDIQKMITDGLIPIHGSGKYRQQAVFVNDPKLRKTVYLPPDHQDVLPLMNGLIEFVNENKQSLDYLILAGIFHQQFVIVHPFIDGNGRTVRLATKVLLAKMGLNTFNLFSFENYYNSNITKYFENVGMKGNYYDEFEKWDFTNWLEYFTDGIIDELNRVSRLLPQATSLSDRLEDYHQIILNLINERGAVKDSDYAKLTERSRASRLLDFQKLIDLGIIERGGKGRATYYKLSK